MSEKVTSPSLYLCNICNKSYSSRNSLWNHNNKFHISEPQKNSKMLKTPSNITQKVLLIPQPNNLCKYCEKNYSRKDNLKRHLLNCKIKKEIEEKKQKEELYKMEEMKLKQLKEVTKQKEFEFKILNKNASNINNGSINNTTTTNSNNNSNNIIINNFGKESVNDLSIKEVKKLTESKSNAFLKVIEMINFSEKRPENHSFCTTSLDGKFTNVFDPKTCEIQKITKNDFFDIVFNGSIRKIDDLIFRFEFKVNEDDEIDEKYIEELQNIASKADNIYSNFRKDYHEDMNAISYNNRKKVLKSWRNAKPNLELSEEDEIVEDIEKTNEETYFDEYIVSDSDED